MPAACAPKRNAPLYRLEGTRPVQIASSAGTLTPLSVDEGRILVDHEDGTLDLLDSEGAALRKFHTDTGDYVGARLQGRGVVVLKHAAIADYDAQSGALLHQWPLSTSDRRLDDVQAGVALYVSDTAVHLFRLADGRDTTIQAPGKGPVLAQLEPSGLFYSYTANDTKYPGRVAFVRFDELPLR